MFFCGLSASIYIMKKFTLLVILLLLNIAAAAQDSGQRAGDNGAPALNNYIYDENGRLIFQSETQITQMLRSRGFGAKGFDPISTGRTGKSTVIRLNGVNMLIGKTDGGKDATFILLGDEKDLGKIKFAYGGYGGFVAGSRQEAAVAGVRAAADYASKEVRIGPNSKAMLKSRGELMGQLSYDMKTKDLQKDMSMIFEITPMAQIENVLGGNITIEFVTQYVPKITRPSAADPEQDDIADFNAVNVMPHTNAAYGAIEYERRIIPIGKVFSKVLVGTISKNAFIHTTTGYKHNIGNDGEITVLIGYIDTMGKADAALDNISNVYSSVSYGNSKFHVNLSVQKSLVEYKSDGAAKKIPQVRLRANMNLDKLAKKKNGNYKTIAPDVPEFTVNEN